MQVHELTHPVGATLYKTPCSFETGLQSKVEHLSNVTLKFFYVFFAFYLLLIKTRPLGL